MKMELFHGSMNDFDDFDYDKTNPRCFFGRGFYFTNSYDDALENYTKEDSADNILKLSLYKESLMDSEDKEQKYEDFLKSIKFTKTLFSLEINVKNPCYIRNEFSEPFNILESYKNDFDDLLSSLNTSDDTSDEEQEENDDKVRDFIDNFYEDVYQEFKSEAELNGLSFEEGDILNVFYEMTEDFHFTANQLYSFFSELEIYDETGEPANMELFKILLEILGFDSIIDETVYWRFGYGSKKRKFMEGLDEDTYHLFTFKKPDYIILDKEYV